MLYFLLISEFFLPWRSDGGQHSGPQPRIANLIWLVNMVSNTGRKAQLKKRLPHHGKWQLSPVAKVNGRPKPELVIIEGKPRRGTSSTFNMQWRENGVRRTHPVGTSPSEALDAWQVQSGILAGDIEPPEEEAASMASSAKTIRAVVDAYLMEVKATKGDATWRAHSADLA